jgi:hypothetical protein
MYSPLPAGDEAPVGLEVGSFSLRIVRADEGGGKVRGSTASRLSPVLPLPVELVAGGEGRPEWLDEVPGLGGSGRSGSSEGDDVEGARGPSPRKIADKGRRLDAKDGREVMGCRGWKESS